MGKHMETIEEEPAEVKVSLASEVFSFSYLDGFAIYCQW